MTTRDFLYHDSSLTDTLADPGDMFSGESLFGDDPDTWDL